jgi:hypothetical protein
MSYAGPGAKARGQLAIELVKARLAAAGLGHFEARYDLIGVNAIFGNSTHSDPPSVEPNEVRVRVAVRVDTHAQAMEVANEVEALYTNGPAGGGGASKSVREVIAAASMLMPRVAIHTETRLLDPLTGEA